MSLTMVLIVEKPWDPDLFRLILCLLKLALSLVTYSHPPPPLRQPRHQPAVGSEPRLQSLRGRSTSSHGGRASWRWKAAEQPSNNLWHLAACNTNSPNAAMAGHAGERIESWTVARCFRCRRARSLDPPSGMLVVAAAIASTTCCRRWKVTIRQNLSHTQSLTSPVWRTWHMIRAKEGRNMPITSKDTPCTQQPVQATETHSLWYHSSLILISLQTAKSYHSCCDLCLCKYIFMRTLMCCICQMGSQGVWGIGTHNAQHYYQHYHIITTSMIIKLSAICRICCWVILRNNLRKPFLLTRKNWRKVRLSQSLFRAREYFQLMNYLIITRVKTFNIRTFTCLADGQGGPQ